ncbi:unnamed protein product [Cuscuta campestris]|uniref:Uncharacterized protein n=1 Tax=Cuscuta campestris TaxID=132261 RepID=A0A484L846_9ASTE|nr:unnamed protein product [Cuscuta campestris]
MDFYNTDQGDKIETNLNHNQMETNLILGGTKSYQFSTTASPIQVTSGAPHFKICDIEFGRARQPSSKFINF